MSRPLRVVSLFDESGNMLRPWAEAGCECYAIDILNEDGRVEGNITYLNRDLTLPDALEGLHPDILFGFPPCTDLATSGSRHWKAKASRNPRFQEEAAALCRVVETLGERESCPWFAENPRSRLSTLWRKPDFSFNPSDYGGYLPEDDVHPRWPDYIVPRDGYPKFTCLWAGGGFEMPPKKEVPRVEHFPGWTKLGGKSAKTKQIRSETPRGFALAVFQHWFPKLQAMKE